jgi:hypothetical protein|tara:strand:+ start:1609 stop:1836 length:228 start_codon:yes stop_codon:yes gene_type:complete
MKNKYLYDHYGQLMGHKVTQLIVDGNTEDQDEPFIGLLLEKGKSKKIAWILMDPEGNGVGHLDIVEAEFAKKESA